MIINDGLIKNRLFIYHQSYCVSFSFKNQYEPWDGIYNGEAAPLGVYVWKEKYQYRLEGAGSEVIEESETVTLSR